jgi:hypothetical protein
MIRKQIIELAQDGAFNTEERTKVAAWLAGNTNTSLTPEDAKKWLSKKENAKSDGSAKNA